MRHRTYILFPNSNSSFGRMLLLIITGLFGRIIRLLAENTRNCWSWKIFSEKKKKDTKTVKNRNISKKGGETWELCYFDLSFAFSLVLRILIDISYFDLSSSFWFMHPGPVFCCISAACPLCSLLTAFIFLVVCSFSFKDCYRVVWDY